MQRPQFGPVELQGKRNRAELEGDVVLAEKKPTQLWLEPACRAGGGRGLLWMCHIRLSDEANRDGITTKMSEDPPPPRRCSVARQFWGQWALGGARVGLQHPSLWVAV